MSIGNLFCWDPSSQDTAWEDVAHVALPVSAMLVVGTDWDKRRQASSFVL